MDIEKENDCNDSERPEDALDEMLISYDKIDASNSNHCDEGDVFANAVMKKQKVTQTVSFCEPDMVLCQELEVTERTEVVDVTRLCKLLSFIKNKKEQTKKQEDEDAYNAVAFYYECFADRDELQTTIRVKYLPAKRMQHAKLGRLYGYTKSFFRDSTRYCGLQSMKKEYRSYLCEKEYWDIDLVNSHPSILLWILLGTMKEVELAVPELLFQAVNNREDLLSQVQECFDTDRLSAKELMLRLMYGGSLGAWLKDHKIEIANTTTSRHADLLNMLEEFPKALTEITKRLLRVEKYELVRKSWEDSYPIQNERTLPSFLSLLLSDHERQILMFADAYLSEKENRPFDVLIHDGGLIRRLAHENKFPKTLEDNLNLAIQTHFATELLKFTNKPLESSLSNVIQAQRPLRIKFGYLQLKYYLEEHLDLAYLSDGCRFLLADRKQTHQYTKEQLVTALAEYTVDTKSIPIETIGDLIEGDASKRKSWGYEQNDAQEHPWSRQNINNKNSNDTLVRSHQKEGKCQQIDFSKIWLKDGYRRKFDAICFSVRTEERDLAGVSLITPPNHATKFPKPRYRIIFQGWPLEKLVLPATEKRGSPYEYLEFIRFLFPETAVYNYVLNWIAHIIQKPDERICGTCLTLIGVEGTGKSTFLTFLYDLVGKFGFKVNNANEQLFGNFTRAMEHSVVVFVDDTNSFGLRNKAEDFKNLITSEDARKNEKFQSERTVVTNARFVLISNNFSVIKIEGNARRFAIFEPSAVLTGDHSYFDELKNRYWVQIRNRKAVLEYFLHEHKIPLNWHPEGSYPKSVLKTVMEAAALDPLDHYMLSLSKTVDAINQSHLLPPRKQQILFLDVPSKELMNKFKIWYQKSTLALHLANGDDQKKLPTQQSMPSLLLKLGVLNTRQLPQPKPYATKQYYRVPIQELALKADSYHLDNLDPQYSPQDAIEIWGDISSSAKEDKENNGFRQKSTRNTASAKKTTITKDGDDGKEVRTNSPKKKHHRGSRSITVKPATTRKPHLLKRDKRETCLISGSVSEEQHHKVIPSTFLISSQDSPKSSSGTSARVFENDQYYNLSSLMVQEDKLKKQVEKWETTHNLQQQQILTNTLQTSINSSQLQQVVQQQQKLNDLFIATLLNMAQERNLVSALADKAQEIKNSRLSPPQDLSEIEKEYLRRPPKKEQVDTDAKELKET